MLVTEKMALEAWHDLNRYAPPRPAGITHPLEQADEAAVVELYRQAVKKTHPDAGGSAEAFAAVDRAKCVLLEWLKKKPAAPTVQQKQPCPVCSGLGHIIQASGLPGRKGLRRQCQTCHGSGDADYDAHGLH